MAGSGLDFTVSPGLGGAAAGLVDAHALEPGAILRAGEVVRVNIAGAVGVGADAPGDLPASASGVAACSSDQP